MGHVAVYVLYWPTSGRWLCLLSSFVTPNRHLAPCLCFRFLAGSEVTNALCGLVCDKIAMSESLFDARTDQVTADFGLVLHSSDQQSLNTSYRTGSKSARYFNTELTKTRSKSIFFYAIQLLLRCYGLPTQV